MSLHRMSTNIELPYVHTRLNIPNKQNETYTSILLWDTGASRSLISKDHPLLASSSASISPTDTLLKSFNGKITQAIGEINADVSPTLSNNRMHVAFLITADLPGCNGILGFDILRKFTTEFTQTQVKMHNKETGEYLTFDIKNDITYHAIHNVLIRPLMETELLTKQYGPINVNKPENPTITKKPLKGILKKANKNPGNTGNKKRHVSFQKVINYKIPARSETLIFIDNKKSNPLFGIQPKLASITNFTNNVNNCESLTIFNMTNENILISENDVIANGFPIDDDNVITNNGILQNHINSVTTPNVRAIPRNELDLTPLDESAIQLGELKPTQKDLIIKLIKKYHYIFSRNEYDIGLFNGPQRYKVELTTDEYQKRRFFSTPPNQKAMLEEHIKKLEKSGIIEPIEYTDEITTQFVIVKKKDGTFRCTNDSRSLNNVTKRSKNFKIPRIGEMLQQLCDHKYYTSLDMNSSFFQIPIEESQKNLYTFISPNGKDCYRYCTAPFGSSQISNVFQSIMAGHVLKGTPALIYIDDINCAQNDFSQHLQDLEGILQRFAKYNLTLKLKKCFFAKSQLECFGFLVDKKGYRPIPARIDKLKTIQPPKTKRQLRGGLASLAYYRNHITNFSEKAAQLYKLSGENCRYKLTPEVEQKWRHLLECLGNCILMTKPEFNGTFKLTTDASIFSIAGTLSETQNGKECIIAVDSMVLSESQQKWACAHLELLACYKFLRKYEKYLLMEQFTLVVDNISVYHILNNMAKYEISGNNPASRYLLYISQFTFECIHLNGDADAFILTDLLSRGNVTPDTEITINKKTNKDLLTFKDLTGKTRSLTEAYKNCKNHVQPLNMLADNFPIAVNIKDIYNNIKLKQKSSRDTQNRLRKLRKRPQNSPFHTKVEPIDNGFHNILYYRNALVVPPLYVAELLNQLHKHESASNFVKKLQNFNLFWPGMLTDVQNFTKTCQVCQTCKSGKPVTKTKGLTIQEPSEPFESLQCDIFMIKDIPVLTMVCCYSNYCSARVMENQTSNVIKYHMSIMILEFNIPSEIQFDNGANLKADTVTDMLDMFGINYRYITPYNKVAQGRIENVNRLFQQELRICQPDVDNRLELEYYIALASYIINCRTTSGSKYCPLEIALQKRPNYPYRLPKTSKSKLVKLPTYLQNQYRKAQEIRSEIFKKYHRELDAIELEDIKEIALKKGDYVKIKQVQKVGSNKKTHKPWSQSNYVVLEVLNYSRTALIEKVEDNIHVRRKRLKLPVFLLKKVKLPSDFEEQKIMDDANICRNGKPLKNHAHSDQVAQKAQIDDTISQKSDNNQSSQTTEIIKNDCHQKVAVNEECEDDNDACVARDEYQTSKPVNDEENCDENKEPDGNNQSKIADDENTTNDGSRDRQKHGLRKMQRINYKG